ncbi:MAG: LysM domain-containing protein [Archangium gephyra]|uniref:LysM domain-containing protein n=1 Tax=Archangium gephyra TaxID=48 RepID=A0A2W5TQ83_9BACT|nr:MAG: LysM domain-containing protein [Archangium gephyra]
MDAKNYRIKKGDTLWAIARRNNTTVAKLQKDNGIKDANFILAGANLKIGHSGASSFSPARAKPPTKAAPRKTTSSAPVASSGAARGSGNLAENARRVAASMGGYRSRGLCATGVSRAIQNTYGIKVWGNGNQIDNNLPKNKFKQVNMSLEQALKTPGLILTWERTSTRLGSIYGHTAITSGDGHTTYSDFIERNTTNNGRSGLKIFAPI